MPDQSTPPAAAGMSAAGVLNLTLRALVEFGVVAGFAYWGIRTGDSTLGKVVLGIAAPAVGFGVWGAVDFRGAGNHAETLRLIEELAISALAAVALAVAGSPLLGALLALLSIAHHALVYLLGQRLLEPSAGENSGAAPT